VHGESASVSTSCGGEPTLHHGAGQHPTNRLGGAVFARGSARACLPSSPKPKSLTVRFVFSSLYDAGCGKHAPPPTPTLYELRRSRVRTRPLRLQ
jgi:hypothetical protein